MGTGGVGGSANPLSGGGGLDDLATILKIVNTNNTNVTTVFL
ncbi:hypothetical protein [Flavobacterium sp. PL11]